MLLPRLSPLLLGLLGLVALLHVRGRLGLLHRLLRLWLLGGVVDGDRDPDRAPALVAQRLPDERREPAFQHALGELVGHGQQGGVRHQGQRLGPLQPVLVLRLEAVALRP